MDVIPTMRPEWCGMMSCLMEMVMQCLASHWHPLRPVLNQGRYHRKLEIEWKVFLFILDFGCLWRSKRLKWTGTHFFMHTRRSQMLQLQTFFTYPGIPSFTSKHTKSQAASEWNHFHIQHPLTADVDRFTRRTWGTTWHVTVTWAFQGRGRRYQNFFVQTSPPCHWGKTFMFPASMIFFIGHSSIKDVIHIMAVHDCSSCRIATNQCKPLGRKSYYSPNQRRQVMLIASTGDAAVAALLWRTDVKRGARLLAWIPSITYVP